MEWLTDPEAWISLLTLSAMEIVLGIDNIVFIAILTSKLPVEQQANARRMGIMLAMFARLGLLFAISWIMSLTEPLFSVSSWSFSGRHLILLVGGLFLIGKATHEIHSKLEAAPKESKKAAQYASFGVIIGQILLIDIVFSLDSVITAVGMAKHISIMAIAMVIAVVVMLIFSGMIAAFVDKHPTIKILALSFLILIGVMLVAEGFDQHVGKGYIYFAMAFSLAVELVNLRVRKVQHSPVALHSPYEKQELNPKTP